MLMCVHPHRPLQERPKGWKEGTAFETKDEGHTLDVMLEVWICCSDFLGLKEIEGKKQCSVRTLSALGAHTGHMTCCEC